MKLILIYSGGEYDSYFEEILPFEAESLEIAKAAIDQVVLEYLEKRDIYNQKADQLRNANRTNRIEADEYIKLASELHSIYPNREVKVFGLELSPEYLNDYEVYELEEWFEKFKPTSP